MGGFSEGLMNDFLIGLAAALTAVITGLGLIIILDSVIKCVV